MMNIIYPSGIIYFLVNVVVLMLVLLLFTISYNSNSASY
jgi:hypothetical protein